MLSWLEGIGKGTAKIPVWLYVTFYVGILVGAAVVLCLPVWYTMLAWNLFVPSVFGLPHLAFLQALGIDLCLAPFAAYAIATTDFSN